MTHHQPPVVVIAVGGTGGHLYPAQVLAEELLDASPHMTIAFLGHGLKTSRFFNREGFLYLDIPSATCSLKKIWTLPAVCIRIFIGMMNTLRFFQQNKPDLVIGFGSYHSLPILIAAYLSRIPYILFEANAVLGKVNRLFCKGAYLTAYQLFDLKEADHSSSFVKTTLPMKAEKLQRLDPGEARRYFGLDAQCITLLIFGGSQGATSLNQLVLGALALLKEKGAQFQVIHLIGFHMDLEVVKETYQRFGIRASVKVHEARMCYAYSAADLLLSRAGANTIAEQLDHQIPAIFIPYPYLADDHQTLNARYVCDRVQGGTLLSQKGLTAEILADHIEAFLEQEFYVRKKEALERKRQEGSKKLSEIVLEVLQ